MSHLPLLSYQSCVATSSLEGFFTPVIGADLRARRGSSRNVADALPSLRHEYLQAEKNEPQSEFPSL